MTATTRPGAASSTSLRVQDQLAPINGLRVHYREWGDPSSPPVVLLHGGSAHAHWWDGLAAAIADRYRVLAPDLRGHGDSEHASPPAYGIEDYVGDLVALAAAARLGSFDLIGHSLGAMVATAFAGLHPEHVNSLVIVDSSLRITPAGARYMVRLRNFPHPVYRSREDAVSRFRLLPTQTRVEPGRLASLAAHSIRQLPDGRWILKFDRVSLAHNEPRDLTSLLKDLSCPILFVRGAHSDLLSQTALDQLLATAPHARSVEIPHAYHHVMLDNPEAFERAVGTFLDRSHRVR